MKILHCISKLKAGGAQTQLLLLANNSDHINYDIHILCWDKDSAIPISDDVTVHLIKKGKGLYAFRFWIHLYKIIKKIGPDVLQLWLPEIMTNPASIIGKILGLKSISCVRRVPSIKKDKFWLRDRISYVTHFFSDVIVVNFPMPVKGLPVFNKIFKKKGGKVIYNGISFKSLDGVIQKKSSDGVFRIVYAGRLAVQKNINLLIKSIFICKQKGTILNLDIFGVGEKEFELKELVSDLKLDDQVIFHGFRANWQDFLSDVDCFVLPSNLEGMPNVLFEAIYAGLPILASNIPEIAAHFSNKKDALLFEVNSEQAIAEALLVASESPDLLSFIYANALINLKKYTISNMVSNYQGIYNKVNNI